MTPPLNVRGVERRRDAARWPASTALAPAAALSALAEDTQRRAQPRALASFIGD